MKRRVLTYQYCVLAVEELHVGSEQLGICVVIAVESRQ